MERTPSALIITLLTDFGSTDYFVGSVKGVILSINPHVTIVDLTHEVASFSVAEAAFLLHSTYPYFPKGSIHVAVVDPGVGSDRRPLLVHAGGFYFLAPDNGILSYVFRDIPNYQCVELTETKFHLPARGNSFHARDVFAPVAAWLSRGTPIGQFGRESHHPTTIPLPAPRHTDNALEGEVIYIDRFGNLITNITKNDVDHCGPRDQLTITIGDARCRGISRCYADGSQDAPSTIVNSSGHLEIFFYEGNAAHHLHAKIGIYVTLTGH